MADDRPEVIAQKNFREHRDTLKNLDLTDRFHYIFEKNLWSSEESRSGSGSTLLETEALRDGLPRLLRKLGANSLLDIPCGDFGWLSTVDLGIPYIGADIVEHLVESNQQRFGSDRRRFLRLDLTSDPLPQADAILCRDCLVHLSFANIIRAFENMKRSGTRWLLTTSFLRLEKNVDIEDGDWRPLNFTLDPFALSAPREILLENCAEGGGAYNDKALCLWDVNDLPGAGLPSSGTAT